MGKIITVMNMKGGVGKTTVTGNLGGVLGHFSILGKARKVLLVDYDPQFNLSQAFLKSTVYFDMEAKNQTSLAILQDKETELDPFSLQVPNSLKPPSVTKITHRIATYRDSFIDIVPSSLDLMYVAIGQPPTRTLAFEQRFSAAMTEARKIYDVILIDCHPAGSILTKTSLQNSDFVLIPVAPQAYAVRGIGLMTKFLAGAAATLAPDPIVLFNAVPRTGISAEETEIRGSPYAKYCLTNTLKKYAAFAEPREGAGWVWASKKSYSDQAKANLLQVATELITRCKL